MRIGDYEITGELARGGMGVVFRAHDTAQQREVVLKLLKVDDPKSRRRLAREADAMSRLVHPNVVPLLAYGEHQGEPYLVLPFVEGESLQDRLDVVGPLDLDEALETVAQIGRGLQATHALGLVHRDVKPANVLLDVRMAGHVLLTDFGLVKDVGPGEAETVTLSIKGRFLGTPGYWPREQAYGELERIGPAADVHALGALLYALLTGHPPRQAETLIGSIDAFNDPIPPLSDAGQEVPLWVEELVLRCLENEPEARPSLEQVLQALREEGLPDPAPARPVGALPRQRGQLGWVAGAAAALAVVGVGGVWLLSRELAAAPAGEAIVEVAGPAPRASLERDAREKKVARLLELAEVKRVSGHWEGALVDYGRCLLLDASCAEAYQGRATVRRLMGRAEDSLGDYAAAIQLSPEPHDAHLGRGLAFYELGRLREALTDFERALELQPERAGNHVNRGNVLLGLGHEEQALRDYELALELRPDYPEAYLARAEVKERLGRWEQALVDCTRGIELDPTNPAGWILRGNARTELGRHAEALEDFDRGLALAPDTVDWIVRRALCLAKLGRNAESLEGLDRALELGVPADTARSVEGFRERVAKHLADEARPSPPSDEALREAERHFGEAEEHFDAQRFPQAIDAYDRALELEPRYTLAYVWRGMSKSSLGRNQEAVADFDRALELDPRSSIASRARGICKQHMGRLDEALADFDRTLELTPDDDLCLEIRGRLLADLGRHEEALRDYDRALELNPERAVLLVRRGQTKGGLQRYPAALADFERALELNPSLVQALVGRATTHAELGRFEEALADYDRALELGVPEDLQQTVRLRRAAVLRKLGR